MSFFTKIHNGLPFWYHFIQVILEKGHQTSVVFILSCYEAVNWMEHDLVSVQIYESHPDSKPADRVCLLVCVYDMSIRQLHLCI